MSCLWIFSERWLTILKRSDYLYSLWILTYHSDLLICTVTFCFLLLQEIVEKFVPVCTLWMRTQMSWKAHWFILICYVDYTYGLICYNCSSTQTLQQHCAGDFAPPYLPFNSTKNLLLNCTGGACLYLFTFLFTYAEAHLLWNFGVVRILATFLTNRYLRLLRSNYTEVPTLL